MFAQKKTQKKTQNFLPFFAMRKRSAIAEQIQQQLAQRGSARPFGSWSGDPAELRSLKNERRKVEPIKIAEFHLKNNGKKEAKNSDDELQESKDDGDGKDNNDDGADLDHVAFTGAGGDQIQPDRWLFIQFLTEQLYALASASDVTPETRVLQELSHFNELLASILKPLLATPPQEAAEDEQIDEQNDEQKNEEENEQNSGDAGDREQRASDDDGANFAGAGHESYRKLQAKRFRRIHDGDDERNAKRQRGLSPSASLDLLSDAAHARSAGNNGGDDSLAAQPMRQQQANSGGNSMLPPIRSLLDSAPLVPMQQQQPYMDHRRASAPIVAYPGQYTMQAQHALQYQQPIQPVALARPQPVHARRQSLAAVQTPHQQQQPVPFSLQQHQQVMHLPQRRASIAGSTPIQPALVAAASVSAATQRRHEQVCAWCQINDTPTWRRGPMGIRLCNACGIRYATVRKRSSADMSSAKKT
jgi:ribosomal protein L37AE/L43A